MKEKIDDAYKRGAEDAWEAARKIIADGESGLSCRELSDIFGDEWTFYVDIFTENEPLEVIEKIRQYEKRNEFCNDFQVGDEVKDNFGFYAVVVRTDVNKDKSQMYVVFRDGSCREKDKVDWTKTGRHFPQIAEVLKAMDEAMGE